MKTGLFRRWFMQNKIRRLNRFAIIAPFLILAFWGTACTANHPPQKPVIMGRGRVFVRDTVVIRIYSVDPEDNVITYFIDWGDTTKPSWSPFFPSGETVFRSHVYNDTGIYLILAKARDIDRAESQWSDTFKMEVEPDTIRPVLSRQY